MFICEKLIIIVVLCKFQSNDSLKKHVLLNTQNTIRILNFAQLSSTSIRAILQETIMFYLQLSSMSFRAIFKKTIILYSIRFFMDFYLFLRLFSTLFNFFLYSKTCSFKQCEIFFSIFSSFFFSSFSSRIPLYLE